MRRGLSALAVVAAFLVVALAGWDFLKAGRQIPQLADQASRATSIVVEKQSRQLTLLHNDKVIKTYRVSLGSDPIGHKLREGDSRTPEGDYTIDGKNRRSRFHLALHISFPDAKDRARAAQSSVPPGNDIMVHGLPNGLGWLGGLHLHRDWTDGCIAVTNAEMEEIWALVDSGTPIQIKP
jgi:murein L,D-transpeptidase YafK